MHTHTFKHMYIAHLNECLHGCMNMYEYMILNGKNMIGEKWTHHRYNHCDNVARCSGSGTGAMLQVVACLANKPWVFSLLRNIQGRVI